MVTGAKIPFREVQLRWTKTKLLKRKELKLYRKDDHEQNWKNQKKVRNSKTYMVIIKHSFSIMVVHAIRESRDKSNKLLIFKSFPFILESYNTGANRKTYMVIIKQSFSIMAVYTIR